jgi:alanyl-tRNA synthetase
VVGEKAQLLFSRSDDVALDVVPLLKSALAQLGSERGGGRPNFAQGGGVAATVEQVQMALHVAATLIS